MDVFLRMELDLPLLGHLSTVYIARCRLCVAICWDSLTAAMAVSSAKVAVSVPSVGGISAVYRRYRKVSSTLTCGTSAAICLIMNNSEGPFREVLKDSISLHRIFWERASHFVDKTLMPNLVNPVWKLRLNVTHETFHSFECHCYLVVIRYHRET